LKEEERAESTLPEGLVGYSMTLKNLCHYSVR
jgi:hypothetical protein